MVVYIINLIILLVSGVLLIYNKPTPKKKALFCLIGSFNWTLISGLRNWSVGADTVGYARSFTRAGQISWNDAFNIFFNVYLRGAKAPSPYYSGIYKDPGYLIFEKIVFLFTNNYQIYLVIVASILFTSLAIYIYINSEDAFFSFILFSTLFYSFYAITGIRQSIATAIIVLLGFEYIKKRNFVKFILLFLIAFTIHKSAIIFLPFYFASQKKINRSYFLTMVLFVILIFIMGPKFILEVAGFIGFEREGVYSANTYMYVSLMMVVGIGIIVTYRKVLNQKMLKNMELNATMIGIVLSLFTLLDQSIMRVQQYYSLFMMLSIPSMLNCFEPRTKFLAKFIVIMLLIFLFINNNPIYKFFWQN